MRDKVIVAAGIVLMLAAILWATCGEPWHRQDSVYTQVNERTGQWQD